MRTIKFTDYCIIESIEMDRYKLSVKLLSDTADNKGYIDIVTGGLIELSALADNINNQINEILNPPPPIKFVHLSQVYWTASDGVYTGFVATTQDTRHPGYPVVAMDHRYNSWYFSLDGLGLRRSVDEGIISVLSLIDDNLPVTTVLVGDVIETIGTTNEIVPMRGIVTAIDRNVGNIYPIRVTDSDGNRVSFTVDGRLVNSVDNHIRLAVIDNRFGVGDMVNIADYSNVVEFTGKVLYNNTENQDDLYPIKVLSSDGTVYSSNGSGVINHPTNTILIKKAG